jgi:hypothetical protein
MRVLIVGTRLPDSIVATVGCDVSSLSASCRWEMPDNSLAVRTSSPAPKGEPRVRALSCAASAAAISAMIIAVKSGKPTRGPSAADGDIDFGIDPVTSAADPFSIPISVSASTSAACFTLAA